jgi:hypothetical protein
MIRQLTLSRSANKNSPGARDLLSSAHDPPTKILGHIAFTLLNDRRITGDREPPEGAHDE